MTLGRTLTTLATPAEGTDAATSIFGPGWTASLPADAGEADETVTDQHTAGYVSFTAEDGGVSTYVAASPVGTYPITFAGVGDAAGDGSVVTMSSATSIAMSDADGTVTTWAKDSSSRWAVASVVQTGSGTTTTYTRNTTGQVTRILAAVPAGITCTSPDTTIGCRSLVFTYTTVAGHTRLASVNLSAYNPATSAMASTPIEDYDYTTGGLLADAYDPRITPNLKTAYTYDATGRLSTVTPPGQAAWTLTYNSSEQLTTVSRPDPSTSPATTAATTIVYGVPFTGTGAPVELGATTTATWDQTNDLPTTATAVFPATRVPAGTTPATVASADWPYSALHYLDANGREVDTATYGAGAWQVSAAAFDTNGNTVWSLTAANRAQALTPTASTDPAVAALSSSVARADLLITSDLYNPVQPTELLDTYGPTHPITLASGTVIDGRDHTHTLYDEGAPALAAGAAPYQLPTTVVTSPYNTATSADVTGADMRTSHTGYAAVVSGDTTGWALRMATTSTVQMGSTPSSADLVTTTRYNAAGQLIEKRLPADPTGVGAGTTSTTYYTATGTGACVSTALAGQICSTGPAAQPSGTPLPVTTYTYDQDFNILTTTETVPVTPTATVRTTTTTYDAGERKTGSSVVVTPTAAGGTALPAVTYGYDSSTGLPTTTATTTAGVTTTLTTTYDSLGRVSTYTDATGNVATTTYDLDGRPLTVADGKGTTTYTYDTTSEHRGSVTSEDVGVGPGSPTTFTETYNEDGSPITETYPNGLVASTTYDNAGNTTGLTYAKSGSTWLAFTAARGADGRIVGQTSPASSQVFGYDADGRLTGVQDTLTGTGCTTRTYTFSANSDRTSLVSNIPGTGGACSTTTTATTTTSTFDTADRITNTGYAYDTLGRTTTVPAVDSVGIGTNAGITGATTVGYYSNDMVNTESEGTTPTTLTYTLDPDQNRINTISDGTTDHYTDDTDSPAWTTTTAGWTRNIAGPDGDMAATIDQTGTVLLDLVNLQGSIIATAPDTTGATAITSGSYSETTEYGAPRAATETLTATTDNYGWLGDKQRSDDSLAGLTLMGARLYNPTTGRFLSVDPIPDGNDNAYTYPLDPLNQTDLSGHFCLFGKHKHGRGCRGAELGRGLASSAFATAGIFAVLACGTGAGCVVTGAFFALASYDAGNAGHNGSLVQAVLLTVAGGVGAKTIAAKPRITKRRTRVRPRR